MAISAALKTGNCRSQPGRNAPSTRVIRCEQATCPSLSSGSRSTNADVCATTRMAEGINAFVAETLKLEQALRAKL